MAIETQITSMFLKKVLLGLLVGALLGLEREYTKSQEVVGVRTFSLLSLLGAVSVIISQKMLQNFIPFLLGFLSALGFSLLLYFKAIEEERRPGFTTNVAIVLSYMLGAAAGYGLFLESVFLSVLISIVLYSRERMHKIVEDMTEKEVKDLLEFSVVLGIIYPLLPAEPVKMLGLTLPLQTVWILLVIISMINFISFIGSRYLQLKYEVPLISLLGGLISSTGTSASLTTQLKQSKGLENTITAGFLLVTAALLVKTLGISSIFNPAAAKFLVPPLIVGIIPLIGMAYYKIKGEEKKGEMKIESPFHIKKAAKFGLAILILIIIVDIVKGVSPELVLLTSFLAGTFTSTSMILSLITLSLGGRIELPTFTLGVVLATLGSLIGDYIIVKIGGAGEIIKMTWKTVLISTAATLLSLLILIKYFGGF